MTNERIRNHRSTAHGRASRRDLRALRKRFRVGSRLHRGKRGIAYRATDPRTDSDVVIKIFDECIDESSLSKLGDIVTTSAEHPYLATVREVGRLPSGRWYQVRDIVFGADLQADFARYSWHPEGAAWFFGECAAGLATLHAAGLTHGHLTTRDILVSRDSSVPQPRIIDVGRAPTPEQHAERCARDRRALAKAAWAALRDQRAGLEKLADAEQELALQLDETTSASIDDGAGDADDLAARWVSVAATRDMPDTRPPRRRLLARAKTKTALAAMAVLAALVAVLMTGVVPVFG